MQIFIDVSKNTEVQHALRMPPHKKPYDTLEHALKFDTAKQASKAHLLVRQDDLEDSQQFVLSQIKAQINDIR